MKNVVVTGGAGFIGSAFIWKLNQMGIEEILVVDNLASTQKWKNLANIKFFDYVHKDVFLDILDNATLPFEKGETAIVHLGACSSTTETDADYLIENNLSYSQQLANYAVQNNLRFIYASSAATYGNGEKGFSDNDNHTSQYLPINMYGYSKHLFDTWLLKMGIHKNIVGLKFFNVFGPNEYHKGNMASVVFKAYHQILETGSVDLFKSHHASYQDGEQKRDFIYIKDVVDVMYELLINDNISGIFNLGSGQANTWNRLMTAVFAAMDKPVKINYIDMPKELHNSYQYFTQANMDKLKAKMNGRFSVNSLEDNVRDYVQNYLMQKNPYLNSLS